MDAWNINRTLKGRGITEKERPYVVKQHVQRYQIIKMIGVKI